MASSRRPYTTPAAVPHTLRETRLSSKWSKPSLQVKAGCYEDDREDDVGNEVTLDYNAGFQSAVAYLMMTANKTIFEK